MGVVLLLASCLGLSRSVCPYQIEIEPQVFELLPNEMCSEDCINRMEIQLYLGSTDRAEHTTIYLNPMAAVSSTEGMDAEGVLDEHFYLNSEGNQEGQIVVMDLYADGVIEHMDPEEYYYYAAEGSSVACLDLDRIDPGLNDRIEDAHEDKKDGAEIEMNIKASLVLTTVLDDGETVVSWKTGSSQEVRLWAVENQPTQFTISSQYLARTQ